jgi:hypothetical protein
MRRRQSLYERRHLFVKTTNGRPLKADNAVMSGDLNSSADGKILVRCSVLDRAFPLRSS